MIQACNFLYRLGIDNLIPNFSATIQLAEKWLSDEVP